jgi:hypothetical protein
MSFVRRFAFRYYLDCKAWHDQALARFGQIWQQQNHVKLGATDHCYQADSKLNPQIR